MAESRRWDGDERGHGFADGSALAPNVAALGEALSVPDWVAEQPDAHLLPHIRRACDAPGSGWRLGVARLEASVFVVDLERDGSDGPGALRAAVFALIASFAESSTHVHERATADGVEFDVATGMLEGQTAFVPHGHLVRLRVRAPGRV